MAHDVFISYSSQDKATADAVCAGLEVEGIRCWIAPRDIPAGSNYGAEINTALKHCAVLVLIFSKPAGESVWVMKEVERAISYRKPVVPFRIDEALPGEGLEFYLASYHWLDAITEPLSKHIAVLARSVLAFVEPEAAEQAAARKRKLTGDSHPAELPKPSPVLQPPPAQKEPERLPPAPAVSIAEPAPPSPTEPAPPLPFKRLVLACAYPSFFIGWAFSMVILQIFMNRDMDDTAFINLVMALAAIGLGGLGTGLLLKKWQAQGPHPALRNGRLLAGGLLATVPVFLNAYILVPVFFDSFDEKHKVWWFLAMYWPLALGAIWLGRGAVWKWYDTHTADGARRRCDWLGWTCGLAIFPGVLGLYLGERPGPDSESFLLGFIAFWIIWSLMAVALRFLFLSGAAKA